MPDPFDFLSEQDPPEPAALPVTVDGGLTKSALIGLIMQAIAAVGAVIAFMGLGESSWIVKTYHFLHSEQAVPVIALAATIGAGIAQWVRARRRSGKMAFMGALLSNRFAVVKGALHPSVQAAVEKATVAGGATSRTPPPADY